MIQIVNEKYKESKLTIETLYRYTKRTMFKTPIDERVRYLGKIQYKGFQKKVYLTDDNNLFMVLELYFIVQGKKNKKENKRPRYLQILQIPYYKDFKKFKYVFNKIPVKIYSSDPSFKYFLAYALNQVNAVVINPETKKELGIALTKRPKIRNPKLHKEMNKHFYKLIEFLKHKNFRKYLDSNYDLSQKGYK